MTTITKGTDRVVWAGIAEKWVGLRAVDRASRIGRPRMVVAALTQGEVVGLGFEDGHSAPVDRCDVAYADTREWIRRVAELF